MSSFPNPPGRYSPRNELSFCCAVPRRTASCCIRVSAKDGAILAASAQIAGLPLPVTREKVHEAWTPATTASRIGTHLHHPGGSHDESRQ
ncbi:hypothetical protein ACIQUM_36890 [Amycolatopsis azurea]|uniref:hypothetical protein n=1 Tax=Amycolatopsis azurea TaxID=36819 RepID=UPI003820B6E9